MKLEKYFKVLEGTPHHIKDKVSKMLDDLDTPSPIEGTEGAPVKNAMEKLIESLVHQINGCDANIPRQREERYIVAGIKEYAQQLLEECKHSPLPLALTEKVGDARELAEALIPTCLTAEQKLEALGLNFYNGGPYGGWRPATGDYYTTSRADLELYQVVEVTETVIKTRYCDPQRGNAISEWPVDTFLKGFGLNRIHVPSYILTSGYTAKGEGFTKEDMLAAFCAAEEYVDFYRWFEYYTKYQYLL